MEEAECGVVLADVDMLDPEADLLCSEVEVTEAEVTDPDADLDDCFWEVFDPRSHPCSAGLGLRG